MGKLLLMAWRNLGRNRRRTALTVAAIAFATLVLIFFKSMQAGGYAEMIESIVRTHVGHLQVQAPGYQEDKDIDIALEDPEAVLRLCENTPGVRAAVPRIQVGMLINQGDHSFGALMVGTDAVREAQVTTLAKVIKEGDYLDRSDPDGIVIGYKLAKNLKAGVGDELVIMGMAADGSTAAARVHVRGIFKIGNGELDRQLFFANLEAAQEWTAMEGRVNLIALLLNGHESIEAVRARLREQFSRLSLDISVLTWGEVMPGIDQGIKIDKAFGKITYVILLLVIAFGILNTFMMSAMERTREFGVMMAIGVKPWTCGFLLLLESQLLFLLSYAVGLILGGGLTLYFESAGIKIAGGQEMMQEWGMSEVMHPDLTFGVGWETFVMVWIIVSLVTLYPMWRVTRFRPAEAIRYV